MELNKKQVVLLDHCMSDFFSGYHKPVIAIPTAETVTCKEVAEAIRSEINYVYDYLESGYTEQEIELFEDFAAELEKTPDDIFAEVETDEDYETDEFAETPYLYFAIAKPVHKYGITFLNE